MYHYTKLLQITLEQLQLFLLQGINLLKSTFYEVLDSKSHIYGLSLKEIFKGRDCLCSARMLSFCLKGLYWYTSRVKVTPYQSYTKYKALNKTESVNIALTLLALGMAQKIPATALLRTYSLDWTRSGKRWHNWSTLQTYEYHKHSSVTC